jgi:hypothetical protein
VKGIDETMKDALKPLAMMAVMLCLVVGTASAASLLDQQQTAVDGQMSVPPESLMQTFTAGKTGTLDRIDLYAGLPDGAAPGDLFVEVKDWETATTIAQATVPASAFASDGSLSWVSASFGSAPTVSAGQQYRVHLRTSSYLWGYNSAGGYAGGEMWVCRTIQFPEGGQFRRCDVFGDADAAFKTYVTDTTPPQTTISMGPSDPTNSTSAGFVLSSTEPGSTFECSLNGSPFGACPSPPDQPHRADYSGLSEGSHTFEARATDSSGNTDPSAASRTWTVDTTAPTLVDVSPADQAWNVPTTSNVTATFSEEMDPSSISVTDRTFWLYHNGDFSSPVAASVSYDAATDTATLDPDSSLEAGAVYEFNVRGGAGGVRDLAGNWLEGSPAFSFTTAPPPPPDTTAPRVRTVEPTNGATGVAPRSNVAATFSEAMRAGSLRNASTLRSNTFTLAKKKADGTTTRVAAKVRYDAAAQKAILDPDTNLVRGAKYVVTVMTSAKDLAGNSLDQNRTAAGDQPKKWTFTVRS